MITAQKSIDEAVIAVLKHTGTCTIDEAIEALPQHKWSEVFSAIDAMSRDGRVVLRRLVGPGYQLSLPALCRAVDYVRVKRLPILSCVGCGYLCDEIHPDLGVAHWVEARHYLTKYAFNWDQLNRIDSTCPACARVFTSTRSGDLPSLVESATRAQAPSAASPQGG